MIQNVELMVTVAVATVLLIIGAIFLAIIRHRERMELSDKYYKLTLTVLADINDQINILTSVTDATAWRLFHKLIVCNIRMVYRNRDNCIVKLYQIHDINVRIHQLENTLEVIENQKLKE